MVTCGGDSRMNEHVMVRLVGYRASVTPYAPFHIRRANPDTPNLIVRGASSREVILDFSDGIPRSVIRVADVAPHAAQGEWHLETSVFLAPWPQGFAVVSTEDAASPAGFDLVGPENAVIYIQGPYAAQRLSNLEALATAGERIFSSGSFENRRWIRLRYEHNGEPWEHAYFAVPVNRSYVALVTAQSPERANELSFNAASELAAKMCAV